MVKDRVVGLHVYVYINTGMNKVTSSFSLLLKGIIGERRNL